MAIRWETPASTWLEDEHSGQFALASSAGLSQIDWHGQSRRRLPDLAALLGASLPATCHCAQIYPEGFVFCPHCGRALRQGGATLVEQARWWGPYSDTQLPRHVPHGLAVTSLDLAESLEARAADGPGQPDRSMPTPPNAHCVFGAASYGFPCQRLLALAPQRNVLQYFDPDAGVWHLMQAEDGAADLGFDVSDYGWLPVGQPRRGEVALVPGRHGLLRLWINPVNESYRTDTVFEARIVSAPGIVRRHNACLYSEDGATRMWSVGPDGGVATFDCAGAPAQGWSRPLAYDGKLAWLHPDGRLLWQPGSAPRYLPWPGQWRPRLAFAGPTQSHDGRLWLLGHDGQRYSFYELLAEAGQFEAVDGARPGFASLLFRRGHEVVGDPWASAKVDDPHQDDALVLPLLRSFNTDRGQPSGLVLRIARYTGTVEALETASVARMTLEWIGRRNVVLGEIHHLARPFDCVPLVYDGALWLHHPQWTHLRGWSLDELS